MLLEELKKDLIEGTPGPWVCHYGSETECQCKHVLGEHGGMGSLATISVDNGLKIFEGGNDAPDEIQAKANARRIARLPDVEQLAILSFEMAKLLEDQLVSFEKFSITGGSIESTKETLGRFKDILNEKNG